MNRNLQQLDRMFNPQSVAVVGVSAEGAGFGRGILHSILSVGFEGRLYPINPKGGSVFGLDIFPSVEAIPEDIDFAIIAVPAVAVPAAVEACRKKGAAGVEIISSGFSELATEQGEELDRQIREIAAKGIRVLGPNCFGIYCPKSGLTMAPGGDFPRKTGPVALLSQSGGLSIDFVSLGRWRGFNFSKVVSFGNGCDLRETEMLEYLRQDPDTEIICMYLEGVRDGREFFRVLRKTALEKPVIVLKGGLSESGGRAVASHTASLGGSNKIWKAALNQCNVVIAETLKEMADAALAFSMLPRRAYKGLTIVGGGGALGVHGADMAELFGISIPPLRADLRDKIHAILPKPGSSANNPVDIANPFTPPKTIKETVLLASQDQAIDLHLIVQLLYMYKANVGIMKAKDVREIIPLEAFISEYREAREKAGKPIVLALPNNRQELDSMEVEGVIRKARQGLTEAGIPVFDQVKDALRAIAAASRYAVRQKAMADSQKEPGAV